MTNILARAANSRAPNQEPKARTILPKEIIWHKKL